MRRSGENSISVASGANALLSAADVDTAGEAFAAADIVLVQLESPIATVEAAVRKAGEMGVRVILNPAPGPPARRRPARPRLRPDAQRARGGGPHGHPGRRRSGRAPRGRPAKARGTAIVVVTLGERGVYASSPGFDGFVPAFKVNPVDTTAAGDVFNGALAVALAENLPLAEALRFAQAAAAISVTRPGAQPSAPTRAEIEALL